MSDTSSLDRIKQLAELYKEGMLSKEEYESEKQLILSGPSTRAPQQEAIPSEIGAYRVIDVIGQGGMGAVYRGRHRSDVIAERQGGDVAIKVMHRQYASNPSFRKRFEREASLGLTLDHPGIVKVHDLVVDAGMLALIMERVEGRELAEMIGEEVGPIPWTRARPIFHGILEAMAYAHENQVIHRDLKSENVLIQPDDSIKILDFGIAKKVGSSGTKTGTGMGTVNYMAPEQYTDAKSVTHLADIYALGMTLYEMLAGRLPWESSATDFAILRQKAEEDLPPPTTYYPDIPDYVVRLIAQATAADPASRPQSVREFLAGLYPDSPQTVPPPMDTSSPPPMATSTPPPTRPRSGTMVEQPNAREAPAPTPQPAAPTPQPSAQAPMAAPAAAPIPVPAAPAPPPVRSSQTPLILAIVVLALVGMGGAALVFFGGSNDKDKAKDDDDRRSSRTKSGATGTATSSQSAGSSDKTGPASGSSSGGDGAIEYFTERITPGTFVMGAPYDELNRQSDEVPHTVHLTKAFHIGRSEVTQGLWQSVMGTLPNWDYPGNSKPVQGVSWNDAINFANALSRQEGLTPAYTRGSSGWSWDRSANGWRLPTEAEWEYSARGGEYYIYAGSDSLSQVGWSKSNSGRRGPKNVMTKSANGYGLYDMTGNVWEWVWDVKGSYASEAWDPVRPARIDYENGREERVFRGGSWDEETKHMRIANRGSLLPELNGWGSYYNRYGLRLARNAD